MIEAELVLGGLKAVFDRPAMSFNGDQLLDGSSGGTPGGEVGEFAVSDMAPDQQAARPQAVALLVELAGVEIGEFEVGPSCRRGPLVPLPADRRRQSAGFKVLAISSAEPPINRFRLQDPNQ